MKSKTKFDPKVIQQFFLDHTEKLVIGLVAILFLYFAYESYSLKWYDKNPDVLKTAIDRAAARIAGGPPPGTFESKAKFIHYADKIEDFKKPIDPSNYTMDPRMNWNMFPPLRLREAPEILAVEQLRAVPGRGAVAVDSAGNAGRRWIVVTGLVPYKKQLAEYRTKFEMASGYDPAKDVPKYAGFLVQRAEVTGAAEQPDWSKCKFAMFPPINSSEAEARMGGRLAAEIADPRFVYPSLTAPLPDVLNTTWGNEAVHAPEIPVVEVPASKDDATGFSPRPAARQPIRGPLPRDSRRFMEREPMGPMVHPTPPRGSSPSTGGGWGNELGANDTPKAGTEGPSPKDEESEVPNYLLLRYVDLDVKPNKQYQYRVFLVLENPNYKLESGVLDDQKLAASPFLGPLTPKPATNAKGEIVDWQVDPNYKWSLPCTSSRVPDDMRLLCGPVTAAKGPQEISADVRILVWEEKTGQNGNYHKDGLIRGTVLNFPGAGVKEPGDPKPSQRDLSSNCLLVDLAGGEPLPDRDREHHPTSPGIFVVLDDHGNLVIHDQVDESKEWDEAIKEPESSRIRQPMGPRRPERPDFRNQIEGENVRRRGGH